MTINDKIKKIKIGMASCGIAAGAEDVLAILKEHAGDIQIDKVGCFGHCYCEPVVEIETVDDKSIIYSHVAANEKNIANILGLGEEGRFEVNPKRKAKELLKVTRLAGVIDPTSYAEYIENGGYAGLKKALSMTSAEVIDEVKKSGLRGRGGGGFQPE